MYRILGQNQAVIVLKILGELLPIILISVGMAMITSHILFPQTLIKQLTRIVDYENILQMRDAMGISIWNNCIIFVAIVLGVCLSVAIVLTNLSISKLRKIR